MVSGNTITASALNQNFTDLATEITNSVAADGQTTISAPIKFANGAAGAPSITFASDTDSGWYRKAANSLALSLDGVDRVIYTTAAASFAVELVASATASFIMTANFSSVVKSASTSHWLLPVGTTGQRPTPAEGMIRQNSTTHNFEYYNGTVWTSVSGSNFPRGYIDGCILANGADATNDITITAGVCRDSTNTVDITVAAMATGKQLDADWAPGDAAGMRNKAVGIANGTYHIYAVAKADGTQDIYAHTSTTVATVITALQAETGGASYVYARRIGSIVRTGAAIKAFKQFGDRFRWVTPVQDFSVSNPGTSAVNRTLTLPAGLVAIADLAILVNPASTNVILYVSALDETDSVPSTSAFSFSAGGGAIPYGGQIQVKTDTTPQIRTRFSSSGASDTLTIVTNGYFDTRGKDS